MASKNESRNRKNPVDTGINDKQRQKKLGNEPNQFDHEFANEPLKPEERLNNKKTKKRQ
ncbi:small acid-soluble spore protein O [Bacillaceae bacterium S4-13-58]